MSPSTEHLTVQSMAPISPHLLYGHADVYGRYRVKIKALMDVKGRGSIQHGAAFNQGSLCVKSIIHLVTVSATPGFCLYIHTVASREAMDEMYSFYLVKREKKKILHTLNHLHSIINNVLVLRSSLCKII